MSSLYVLYNIYFRVLNRFTPQKARKGTKGDRARALVVLILAIPLEKRHTGNILLKILRYKFAPKFLQNFIHIFQENDQKHEPLIVDVKHIFYEY